MPSSPKFDLVMPAPQPLGHQALVFALVQQLVGEGDGKTLDRTGAAFPHQGGDERRVEPAAQVGADRHVRMKTPLYGLRQAMLAFLPPGFPPSGLPPVRMLAGRSGPSRVGALIPCRSTVMQWPGGRLSTPSNMVRGLTSPGSDMIWSSPVRSTRRSRRGCARIALISDAKTNLPPIDRMEQRRPRRNGRAPGTGARASCRRARRRTGRSAGPASAPPSPRRDGAGLPTSVLVRNRCPFASSSSRSSR